MFRSIQSVLCVFTIASLAACSSGGDGGGGTPGTGDGSSMTPVGGGDSGNGSGDGSTPGPGAGAGADDLSHAGTDLPKGPEPAANDPLVSSIGRDKAAAISQPLGFVMEAVENHSADTGVNCKQLEAEYASCSVLNLHVKDGNGVLTGTDWKLYFHSVRRILRVDSDKFDVVLVNGDLNYLTPAAGFEPFAGDVATIKLITEFNFLVETDFMPRAWLVQGNGSPELIANTDSETDENTYAVELTGNNRKAWDTEPNPIATATTRYNKNSGVTASVAALSAADIQRRVVPNVTSMTAGTGNLSIVGGLNFTGSDLSAASAAVVQTRSELILGGSSTPVVTELAPNLPVNTYTVDISADGILVQGRSDADLFYGAQTVIALVQPGLGTLPYVSITDSPRFEFRGMHIDVARNFHSLSTLKRFVDQMAAYKMNKLHMHLTDDEGWRLEIAGLPELTSVSGKRQFQLDGNGFVTEQNSLMPQLGSGPSSNNQGTGFYSEPRRCDGYQRSN